MNVSSGLQTMKKEQYFADVTHNVILTASSPLFSNLHKNTKYPHTLTYIQGMTLGRNLVQFRTFCAFFKTQIAHKLGYIG